MKDVYILSAVRTAVGSYGGCLRSVPSHRLAELVMRAALERAGTEPAQIDEVILGEVRQSTEASNMARCAALAAGIPEEVPAYTVNRLCASAMQAIYNGWQSIQCGDAGLVVAGGSENMSRAPHYLRGGRFGDAPLTLVDSNLEAGTTAQPAAIYGAGLSMGITAENVAERYRVSREEQDRFAAESQRRAQEAIAAGYFTKEIIPVEVQEKKRSFAFQVDEFPRQGVTVEALAKLRPSFRENGTVTAGNSCGRNDGASAVVIASQQKTQKLRLRPQARIVGVCAVALDPAIMGYGPVPAIQKVLGKTGMTLEQIDLFEINEAFAAQAVACVRNLGLDPQRVNIGGGAIALGHPLGSTGCRLVVTLLHHLKRLGRRYGLAALCVGGGQGMAVIIENLD